MPQARTLIRTVPVPGAGIGRSTISKGPFGRETCATRMVAMRFLQKVPDIPNASRRHKRAKDGMVRAISENIAGGQLDRHVFLGVPVPRRGGPHLRSLVAHSPWTLF